METSPKKVGNGFHHDLKDGSEGSTNRLRIQGTAILERNGQPSLSASYNYSTLSADEFFEEDVDRLKFFELNKIALGLTIHRKDEELGSKNGLNGEAGIKNGSASQTSSLKTFTGKTKQEPFLTDVIWSRMDMTNPSANPNAYIIKQYYKNGLIQRIEQSHGDTCDNFLCGFISCLLMLLLLWCALVYIPNNSY